MAWLYLICVAAAALGLLLAGIGICVEAHTSRRQTEDDALRRAKRWAKAQRGKPYPPPGEQDRRR